MVGAHGCESPADPSSHPWLLTKKRASKIHPTFLMIYDDV